MYKTEKDFKLQLKEYIKYTQENCTLNMKMTRSAKEIMEYLNKNANEPAMRSARATASSVKKSTTATATATAKRG